MLKIKCCKECPGLISSYPPGNYFCNKTMKRIKNIEILACKEIKKRHYTTIYKSSVLSDIFKRPNPKFEFIKKELKRKNISYQKLADMLKVSKSSIFKAIKTNSAYASRHRTLAPDVCLPRSHSSVFGVCIGLVSRDDPLA